MSALIRELREQDLLSVLDEQLSQTLCELGQERHEHVQLAIALLSHHIASGHVCLPIAALSQPKQLLGEDPSQLDVALSGWPDPRVVAQALQASALCEGKGGHTAPLVFDAEQRLYFRRHYACEQQLAALLRARAGRELLVDSERLEAQLCMLFDATPEAEEDLQRSAAKLATQRALCVISGGPGTGKTSTVVKILAVVVEQALAAEAAVPRIGLVAPTGKAAVRLASSIQHNKHALEARGVDARVLAHIPEDASTIHRLLSARERSRRYEPGALPAALPLDLLLVDETSMVDLELMTQLLAALPTHARVILLGDRDQLASVEAGAVFGDICGVAQPARTEQAEPGVSPLRSCIIQLTKSYRYDDTKGIGQLARAVQERDPERALAILADPRFDDVVMVDELDLTAPDSQFAQQVVEGFTPYLRASDPAAALKAFDGYRVLCAHRKGERGVSALNSQIEQLLEKKKRLDTSLRHYAKRPLMITQNDYRMRLWNGDIGMVWDWDASAGLAAVEGDAAERPRGRSACFLDVPAQSLRRMGLGRLPPHESAFALSVHKSQGSEVDVVSLVLPREPSRILSRELVYTALTRAKQRVIIHGSAEVLRAAILQNVERSTGLRDLLGLSCAC